MLKQKQLKGERICFSSLYRGPVLHGIEVKAKEPEAAALITFKIRKQEWMCGTFSIYTAQEPSQGMVPTIVMSLYLN